VEKPIPKRTDLWTLPPIALREVVINAIVPADYAQRGAPIRVALFDDRLEIENPGLVSEKPLEEPAAWYGPILMNTQEPLQQAFQQLEKGNF
jgi:Pirin C-terminal cupin domain